MTKKKKAHDAAGIHTFPDPTHYAQEKTLLLVDLERKTKEERKWYNRGGENAAS